MLLLLIICSQQVFAQCHESIREQALKEAGIDAFYLSDFKVKLKAGTMKSPVRFQKFRTQLDSGVTYRLTVTNNPEFEGQLIMQLMDRNNVLGSTFDVESKVDNQRFEYTPEVTKTYTLLSSFKEGRKGCALGVLSMVVQDSVAILDHRVTNDSITEVLYMNIENPVTVAMAAVENGYMDVNITKGDILERDGQFFAVPSEKGSAKIISSTFDNDSIIHESDTTEFMVIELPSPIPKLGGFAGGFVSKSRLNQLQKVEFDWYVSMSKDEVEILDLIVSGDQFGVSNYRTKSLIISPAQKRFLNGLNQNDIFFIQLRVKLPDGTIRLTDPVRFTIY